MHCQLMMSVRTLHLTAIVQICHSRNHAAFIQRNSRLARPVDRFIKHCIQKMDIELEVADN